MSKIRVDTVATVDESTSVPTATLTALPARMTAAENGKAAKGANSDITELNALTKAIAISQGGTGATTADAARSALGVIGRNRIINGDCRIAQRSSLVVSNNISGYGGPDRYVAANSGAGGQFTQSAGTIVDGAVSKTAVVQTVNTTINSTNAGLFWTGIAQTIEGFNSYDLVGQPIGVSFLFKTNVTGTFTVALIEGSNSFLTTFSATANVPVKVAFTAPANQNLVIPVSNAAGLTVQVGALNAGTLMTSNINAWQAGNYKCVSGVTNWGLGVGNYISLTDLQVEVGTPTPFERRQVGYELFLCRRYFMALNSCIYYTQYYGIARTGAVFRIILPVEMRTTPTAIASSISASNHWGAPTVVGITPSACQVNFINDIAGNIVYGVGLLTLESEL